MSSYVTMSSDKVKALAQNQLNRINELRLKNINSKIEKYKNNYKKSFWHPILDKIFFTSKPTEEELHNIALNSLSYDIDEISHWYYLQEYICLSLLRLANHGDEIRISAEDLKEIGG